MRPPRAPNCFRWLVTWSLSGYPPTHATCFVTFCVSLRPMLGGERDIPMHTGVLAPGTRGDHPSPPPLKPPGRRRSCILKGRCVAVCGCAWVWSGLALGLGLEEGRPTGSERLSSRELSKPLLLHKVL